MGTNNIEQHSMCLYALSVSVSADSFFIASNMDGGWRWMFCASICVDAV